jgi:DNA-binding NtrC family response regulator
LKEILVVDDNPDFLQVLSSVLRKNFKIYEAAGVKDALKVIETVHIDAICSDFNMGDGTGMELLRIIREKNVQIPFLLMSGIDDTHMISQAQRYGATFCCKTDYDLIERIKEKVNQE